MVGIFALRAGQPFPVGHQRCLLDDQSIHFRFPLSCRAGSATAALRSAGGWLVKFGKRDDGQFPLAAHVGAAPLAELPGIALEGLGLCRVATVGGRADCLRRAAGEC